MTAENRLNGVWMDYDSSFDSSDQIQERKPRGYFKKVIEMVQGHAQYLEGKGIKPHVLAPALHEFVLKYASDCKVARSDMPPYTVTLSFEGHEAVVYGKNEEEKSTRLEEAFGVLATQGLAVLAHIENYTHKVTETTSKVRELFVSQEEKCFERARQFANQASRTQSFDELLTQLKKLLAEGCPDGRVEVNKLNDIFVVVGERSVRIFTNDTYPYPDDLFPVQSPQKEKKQDDYFDPNIWWD